MSDAPGDAREQHPIVRLLGMKTKRVVGLMSGTSLDGIDAALVEIDGFGPHTRARLVSFATTPYSAGEREALHGLFSADTRAICEGSFRFGARLAEAALAVIAQAGLTPREVDLVGSHGQTIWHQPPSQSGAGATPSTLQIGEPAVIAARTGLVTVADFRVADVALGGEGAPLVPWVDWALFREPGRARVLQNIGGIANCTLVTEALSDLLAFDNGPGNMMIDALAVAATHGAERFDRDGAFSARGRVQEDVLARLLDDDYLRQPPPKSTGRERYGARATQALLAAHPDRAPLDLLATAVAFTARAIADSYRAHVLARVPRLDEVRVSGGGAHNRTLMAHLERLLQPIPVRPFDGGVGADAKEAVAFAILAVQALHAQPANVPSVTGALRPAVLGKLCLP